MPRIPNAETLEAFAEDLATKEAVSPSDFRKKYRADNDELETFVSEDGQISRIPNQETIDALREDRSKKKVYNSVDELMDDLITDDDSPPPIPEDRLED